MTFVYCNVARLLHTRGQSHEQDALRKQSVQPGYSPGWESAWTWLEYKSELEFNEYGCTGHAEWVSLQSARGEQPSLARSSVYTMYGFALSFAHDDRDSSTEYIARRCAYQVYIASRQSREVQDLRAAFPAFPIVAYKYRIHCIRYFKAFPLSRHLIAILRISNAIYHCETCTRENLSDEQSCPRMKYEFTEKTETEIVIKRAWYYRLNSAMLCKFG